MYFDKVREKYNEMFTTDSKILDQYKDFYLHGTGGMFGCRISYCGFGPQYSIVNFIIKSKRIKNTNNDPNSLTPKGEISLVDPSLTVSSLHFRKSFINFCMYAPSIVIKKNNLNVYRPMYDPSPSYGSTDFIDEVRSTHEIESKEFKFITYPFEFLLEAQACQLECGEEYGNFSELLIANYESYEYMSKTCDLPIKDLFSQKEINKEEVKEKAKVLKLEIDKFLV